MPTIPQPGFNAQQGPNAGANVSASPTSPALPATILPIVKSFGAISFDAVVTEKHSEDATITDQPIENGSSVSDHAFSKPRKLTLRAIVSNAFLGDPTGDLFSQNGTRTRAQNAWDMLRQLKNQFIPFDIVTGLLVYSNMVIEKLSTEQDVKTSSSLVVDIDTREVVIVTPQAVSYAAGGGQTLAGALAPGIAAAKKALAAFNMGTKPGARPTNQSLLSQVASFAGGN